MGGPQNRASAAAPVTWPIVFGPAARAEMLEAVDWYDAHAPGLGGQLVAEIEATMARIAANPRQFPIVLKKSRRARLHRFPYALFFQIEEAELHVFACFHSNRDPKRWHARSKT